MYLLFIKVVLIYSLLFLYWRVQLEMIYWTRTVSPSMNTDFGTRLMFSLSSSLTSMSTVQS